MRFQVETGSPGNHLHVLVRNRPDIRDGWTDEEVARRWWRPFRQRRDYQGKPAKLKATELQVMLADSKTQAEWRRRLGHISWFMRCLAENIAARGTRRYVWLLDQILTKVRSRFGR